MDDQTDPRTDLEELEERIAELQAIVDRGPRNLWTLLSLERLKEARDRWYDENGRRRPFIPTPEAAVQFSPPEVLNVPGWQNILPTGYGDIPEKYAGGDPFLGLNVSIARSNGCVRIKNQYESGNLWRDNPRGVAEYYRAKGYEVSERLIRMAGYAMADWWVMLPTCFHSGAYTWMDDYTWTPEGAPFNDEEQRVWREMFNRYHWGLGPMSPGLAAYPLQVHPERETDREPVGGRHLFVAIPNHPQWVIPAVITLYNSGNFKRRQYRAALTRAHAIDNGDREPADGYGTFEEFGFTGTYAEFCQLNERSSQHDTPTFEAPAEEV